MSQSASTTYRATTNKEGQQLYRNCYFF